MFKTLLGNVVNSSRISRSHLGENGYNFCPALYGNEQVSLKRFYNSSKNLLVRINLLQILL